MAYIGQSIKNGTFTDLGFTGTFNSSTTDFNLGTQVGSAAQLLVSKNGVIQRPGTDYTLATGGTQISFTSAPASGDSIFIVEISGAVGGPINSDLNGNELVLDVDGDTSITADTDDQIDFKVGGSDIFQMTASKLDVNGKELILDADADTSITADTDDQIDFKTGGTDRARIDSSGNVFIGTTNTNTGVDSSSTGFYLRDGGQLRVARDNSQPIVANRLSGDGVILDFRKDGTTIGSVNVGDHDLIIGKTDGGVQCYLRFAYSNDKIIPSTDAGGTNDNLIDLGDSGSRFDDIHATNGTIQTSDKTEKQSIQSLTSAEIAVAKKISKLFKTFKFNSAVEKKGDSARTHTGIIAQDVQQAFSDEGLDSGDYGMFISSTWWENDEGHTKEEETEGYTKKTRLGIRYPELLSFVSSAFEQRLTDIETRVTTLEG